MAVKARSIARRSIEETWQQIGDKPMPSNIRTFLLTKKDFFKVLDFLGGNSPHNQALFVAEYGRSFDPSIMVLEGFVVRRFIAGELFFAVILRRLTPHECRNKNRRIGDLELNLQHELEHIYYDELDGQIRDR